MTRADADRVPVRARRPWPLIAFVLVLVAGGAFAAGRFSAFDATTAPNPADIGFARDMQVHHAQAVEMAMIEYRATDDDELRALAYDIATAQAAQRGEMYGWLVAWGLPQAGDPLMSWMSGTKHDHGASAAASAEELEAAMGMATAEEIDRLESLDGSARDCLFLELMIRHHAGAIEMTDAVVELGSDERVIQTARSMGQSQTAEIAAMQSIQARLGCTS